MFIFDPQEYQIDLIFYQKLPPKFKIETISLPQKLMTNMRHKKKIILIMVKSIHSLAENLRKYVYKCC